MKKWLVAVFFPNKDNILGIRKYQISNNATDISVPENTVFFFYSLCNNINIELGQIKISQENAIAWIGQISSYVFNRKLFSYGRMEEDRLIVDEDEKEITLGNFSEILEKNNLKVEFL